MHFLVLKKKFCMSAVLSFCVFLICCGNYFFCQLPIYLVSLRFVVDVLESHIYFAWAEVMENAFSLEQWYTSVAMEIVIAYPVSLQTHTLFRLFEPRTVLLTHFIYLYCIHIHQVLINHKCLSIHAKKPPINVCFEKNLDTHWQFCERLSTSFVKA